MTGGEKIIVVKCPHCGRAVEWTDKQLFKPFCSERCKLVDLGEWIMEEKCIPGQPVPDLDDSE